MLSHLHPVPCSVVTATHVRATGHEVPTGTTESYHSACFCGDCFCKTGITREHGMLQHPSLANDMAAIAIPQATIWMHVFICMSFYCFQITGNMWSCERVCKMTLWRFTIKKEDDRAALVEEQYLTMQGGPWGDVLPSEDLCQ
jgi:hypothetical protein